MAAGYVINAAGLRADSIACQYGFVERHRIVPFKGWYLHTDSPSQGFRVHISPVPDLDASFLGVHITVTADGGVKLAEGLRAADYRRCARSGIRAQLVDLTARTLEMDFRFEGAECSLARPYLCPERLLG